MILTHNRTAKNWPRLAKPTHPTHMALSAASTRTPELTFHWVSVRCGSLVGAFPAGFVQHYGVFFLCGWVGGAETNPEARIFGPQLDSPAGM